MTLNKDDLIRITDKPIVPDEIVSGISWEDCGALVTFTGKVRGYSNGKRVLSLEHEANARSAYGILTDIASQVREKWDLGAIAFCYRTGPVEAGGITLVIAVTAIHRPDAFAACQYAVDLFKQKVKSKEVREDD
jgi:molybdopterin synthase catalytic subunit